MQCTKLVTAEYTNLNTFREKRKSFFMPLVIDFYFDLFTFGFRYLLNNLFKQPTT